MKRNSRIATVAVLTYFFASLAGTAIAQDGAGSSVQYFEAVTDVSTSAGTSTSAPRSAASNGRFNMSFRTLGRSFDLELEPNDLFVDGARTTWIDDSGVVELKPQQIFYRGRIRGESDSWVRLTLQGGTLEGMAWTPDETYFFEPAAAFLGEPADGTIAYRLSDTESEWTDDSCAVEGDRLRHHRHRQARSSRTLDALESLRSMLRSTSAPETATALSRLQVGIVGDWQLFQRHGGASDTYIQGIMNLVDGVYQREINVKVEIINTIIYATSNDPFSDTSNPSSRLNEFGAYRNANDNSPGQLLYGADLAHLFTGVDLNGSTVGIAWVGSVCETITGAGVSQDYSSNLNTQVSLTAHEIGHNLNARHDSDVGCPSGFIMWPSVLTVSDLQNLHFSSCSKAAIAPEVASASCMDDFNPGTPTPTPTSTPTPTNTPPPPNQAEFVSQSVPSVMNAGEQYQVSVTMRNTGSATWTLGSSYRLGSQNPHDNITWGTNRVDMNGGDSIGTGQQKTFSWTVTAPTSAGTYDFQWRMLREGVTWFGELSTNVRVTVQGSAAGPPNAAEFVSQSVPTTVQVGQQVQVSVTMRNAGSNTWTLGSLYRLGSQNPPDNTVWGANRIDLNGGDSVAPGEQKTFAWTMTAPSTPGVYDFQWRMVQEGVEWFGDPSQNLQVTVEGVVPTGPPNVAEFVSQSVPSTVQAGQQVQVSVTMRNAGSATWTAASLYRLGSQNSPNNITWGANRILLSGADAIAPGQQKTFSWTMTAPSTPGTYNFQWRMVREGVEWFGDFSPNVQVTVEGAPTGPPNAAEFVSQSVPSVVQAGQQFQVSVTMRNAGSATWTAASLYRLGSQNPPNNTNFGTNRIFLSGADAIASGQQKTFSWTATAPSTPGVYNFQWRMVLEGVTWFGPFSPNVSVTVQ